MKVTRTFESIARLISIPQLYAASNVPAATVGRCVEYH